MQQAHVFSDVTLLITHYNRSQSLERLLTTFHALGCVFQEIVVSDDSSELKHVQHIRKLQEYFTFKLITTSTNRGLGNNINKGQTAVTANYTLYIQEDFVPKPLFPTYLKKALEIMNEQPEWDLITFYSYSSYPYLIPYDSDFSEKKFHWQPWYPNHLKFYVYGDHPHLRRSSFLKKFGPYKEGVNGDQTEMNMALSFIKHKGRALLYNNIYELLDQKNSESEPSTATFRKNWRQRDSPAIRLARKIYLVYKSLKLTLQLITYR